MRYVLLICAGVMLTGCATTRHYQVILKNQTPEALTIGLAKNGGPAERDWVTPEELAIVNPQGADRPWGAVVPPGKTASQSVTGKFYDGEAAFLRVYSDGNLKRVGFSDLLAISRGAPNRLDLRIEPGRNAFIIRDERGVLQGLPMDSSAR
jgi:hypothetical protein